MIEIIGNAWIELPKYDGLCITTNGSIKKNGKAVMGRGIAAEARVKFPGVDATLAKSLKENGNHFSLLITNRNKNRFIFSFPVKHKWYEKADIELIKRSCLELNNYALENNLKILLPKPGCGNGQLQWEDVKKEIENLLSDNIYIIDFY